MDYSLKIIPLGGLGEIGKNMMAIDYAGDIIVIDSGVMFPDEGLPGIDLIIQDITYLKENKDRVKGILITHGHEDHTGALPFTLRELNVPVYAPPLAKGLIEVKLREHRDLGDVNIYAIEPDQPINLGCFEVSFFRVTHSIPDAMGLAIRTPLGLIVHTGDFKIDHTPVDGRPTDLTKLAAFGDEGVFLLLSDSTYANVPGYTPSEKIVGQALEQVIANAEGRVMIATFASLISRIQEILVSADRHNRKVAFVGRSMVANVNMALKMGYLTSQDGLIITLKETENIPGNRVVIVTTGSQGEPTSALVRISNGMHRDIIISAGDTVVISASPIPGNETFVSKTIDNLLRQGANVLYDKIALVHVHGHASQEELKLVLRLVRPYFFVPVHGEHRHLKAHAALAYSVGVQPENIFILENGDVLELAKDSGGIVDEVIAGAMYVDGKRIYAMDSALLKDRKALSRDGILVIMITRDPKTNTIKEEPKFVSKGFLEEQEEITLKKEMCDIIAKSLEESSSQRYDKDIATKNIRERVSGFINQRTRRRPIIIPVISEA
jgi:ribonuclease J